MNSKILVDIIVPVYRVEKYIKKSLMSICNQNFYNYRIIIVNDGTPDKSMEIAYDVLKNSGRNYLVINQNNKGLPGARNSGLKASSAKYVVFVDSDDILANDFISSLFAACEHNYSNASFCDYEITTEKNREGKNNKDNGSLTYTRDELLLLNMTRKIKIHLCATLLNRQFLLNNNLFFDEKLRFGEEVDYTWRLFPMLDKMVHVKSAKYKYLVRPNSLMTMQNTQRVLYLFDHMHDVISKWFADKPEDEKNFKWVEYKIYIEKVHACAQQSDYKTFKKMIEASNYKNKMKKLKDFPDIKIRCLALLLNITPYLYWKIFQF